MILLQQEIFGEQVDLTGQQLADIISFVHNVDEQRKFSEADIPHDVLELIDHTHGGHEEHPHDGRIDGDRNGESETEDLDRPEILEHEAPEYEDHDEGCRADDPGGDGHSIGYGLAVVAGPVVLLSDPGQQEHPVVHRGHHRRGSNRRDSRR